MKINRLWLYALILIWGSGSALQALGQNAGCPDKPATLILHGGKVFTGNDAQPQAEAVAIRGKLIVGVGNTADLLQRADANTKLVDLQGKLLIPGFNNAHVHLLPVNTSGPFVHDPMESIIGPGPTATQMYDYLKAAAASAPKGSWLYGMAGQAIFDDPSVDRFALDKVVPDYPVMLIGSGGHWLYLNTAAIKAAGLSETEPDTFGGFYQRVPGTNVINGIVIGYAEFDFMRRTRMPLSDEAFVALMAPILDEQVRLGVTTIQDMTFGFTLERAEQAFGRLNVPVRIRNICLPLTPEEAAQDCLPGRNLQAQTHRRKKMGHQMVYSSGVKWIPDGTPLERGSALTQPYTDKPGWTGYSYFKFSEVVPVNPPSQPLILHAIGDKTIDDFLSVIPDRGSGYKKLKTVQMVHGDVMRPDQIPRLAAKDVIFLQNPTHFGIPDILAARFGERMAWAQPLKSVADAGIKLALGPDAIGGGGSPYVDIMLAAMHPGRPTEALTVEQAFKAHTQGSAEAELMGELKGTIEAGKLADLAVLSQDIFTVPLNTLPATVSLMTIVDGRIVYDAGVLAVTPCTPGQGSCGCAQ